MSAFLMTVAPILSAAMLAKTIHTCLPGMGDATGLTKEQALVGVRTLAVPLTGLFALALIATIVGHFVQVTYEADQDWPITLLRLLATGVGAVCACISCRFTEVRTHRIRLMSYGAALVPIMLAMVGASAAWIAVVLLEGIVGYVLVDSAVCVVRCGHGRAAVAGLTAALWLFVHDAHMLVGIFVGVLVTTAAGWTGFAGGVVVSLVALNVVVVALSALAMGKQRMSALRMQIPRGDASDEATKRRVAALCDSAAVGCSLTAREAEILPLLVLGYSDSDVAERFCLSRNTVRSHIRAIYRKLGVHSKDELREALFRG